jgi:hypothetical protein
MGNKKVGWDAHPLKGDKEKKWLSRSWSDNKLSSMIMKRFWHKACRLG